MAVLPVNSVTRAGLSEAGLFNAATAGGDLLPNDGRQWIEVINGSGSAVTVTVPAMYTASNALATIDAFPQSGAAVTWFHPSPTPPASAAMQAAQAQVQRFLWAGQEMQQSPPIPRRIHH